MLGISVMNPVDVVKTRIQIAGGGRGLQVAQAVVRAEGVKGLYTGLTAQFLRAWTYQTARFGAYRTITGWVIEKHARERGVAPAAAAHLSLGTKIACGLAAGGFAAIIGCPAEVCIVRTQADKALPASERIGYKGVFDVLTRTVRSEGVMALWRGSTPSICRAMALNASALASYDHTKEAIEGATGSKGLAMVGGSAISGVLGAVSSLPFDYVKTQLQRMRPDANGVMPYSSSLDCVRKTLKKHGPLHFYTGLPTYTLRIAPMISLTWIFMEGLLGLEARFGL